MEKHYLQHFATLSLFATLALTFTRILLAVAWWLSQSGYSYHTPPRYLYGYNNAALCLALGCWLASVLMVRITRTA